MIKIIKAISVLSLIGWLATFVVSVKNWGSRVDAPIRMASEAGNILEMVDHLEIAASSARQLVSPSTRETPDFKRWLALVRNARDSAFVAESPAQVMVAVEQVRLLNEYEMPPFGVSLPGNPWLFWGWGLVSLVAFGVSAVAGRKASVTVHDEPTRQQQLRAWHAE